MIIKRELAGHIRKMLRKFPVVSVTGPRQSGKTTMIRNEFPDYEYVNLERTDIRELIWNDPAGFLKSAGRKVILDEIQNVPALFSQIQVLTDERGKNGQFILSGSHSFLLNQHISQSLSGRVSINHLLPFSIPEIKAERKQDIPGMILKGFYPRLHTQKIKPADFYPSYIQSYIERDIRSLKAVENLGLFTRFTGLCAGRTGQILNLSSLANDTGISVNTARSWLSLLETSYIIFTLKPWWVNLNKRIIKAPKIYFYDTGVAASLLRLTEKESLRNHYLYGALFENLVISELMKSQLNRGLSPSLFYWRESNGTEIDCIIDNGNTDITALEIKAGETFSSDYLRNLKLFAKENKRIRKMVVYAGNETSRINDMEIISWDRFIEDPGLRRRTGK